jgi:hypothetical protein
VRPRVPWLVSLAAGASQALGETRDACPLPRFAENDKFREYTRYAEYCLIVVASTRDQELRCAQREMAAEWLRLAGAVRRPRKFKQMQIG